MARVVCDFPAPVRTAHAAMTGMSLSSIEAFGPMSEKSAPAREDARCLVHDVDVREVRVGEVNLIDTETPDQIFEICLRKDGDPIWVEVPRQLTRGRSGPLSRVSALR